MSFFDKIKNAIFGKAEAAPQTSAPAGTPAATASPAAPAAPAPTAAAPAPAGNVDVASILDAAVKQNGQKLDWKHSIVDLMKALNLDSSLSARKELAGELGYTGDTSDSATMNIWLHKAVIKKLSENGGKVPADLLD
jgi:3-oxoacyl-ACP reductase-like protein